MKNILSIVFIVSLSIPKITGAQVTDYSHPYGICCFNWPLTVCEKFKSAGIDRYRIMCNWSVIESTDNIFNWSSVATPIDNASITGARVSLCVYDSPLWSREITDKSLSFQPSKYTEFLTELLRYCENRHSGIVEAVEITNEEPTADNYLSYDRDPSWFYANILKSAYQTVKSFNPNILVVIDGIWQSAFHHLDELYQLGCKGYFDRINYHWLMHEGYNEDPSNKTNIWHYPTAIRYLKYIADEYKDYTSSLWITAYGFRLDNEQKKSDYSKFVLDTSRESGFIDRINYYVGITGGYNQSLPDGGTNYDRISMIYTDDETNPSLLQLTSVYYMYTEYTAEYPEWGAKYFRVIDTLPPAISDINLTNSGFETGTNIGWDSVYSVDNIIKHSGNYSGKQVSTGTIRTIFYPCEQDKLYEIIAWIKIDADNGSDSYNVRPYIVYRNNGAGPYWFSPPNYYGVVDTRNYPGGWRKIRYYYLSSNATEFAVEFSGSGNGIFWVDDLIVKSLTMTSPVVTGTGYKSGIFYNFPNPFNPNKQSTRIIYGIEKQSKISLRIYNINGELIRELIPQQEITIPGRYGIDWDGRNDSNQMVASGVYICCLVINDKPYTRKIALIK